jgi:TonB family protein
MMRLNKKGTAVVEARHDQCGRILEVRLAKSSGHAPLNKAALEAVGAYVLSAKAREASIDGWVTVPVRFGGVSTVAAQPLPWPKSHRRPEYRRDDDPIAFATIAAFEAAAVRDTTSTRQAPYASAVDASGNRVSTTLYPDRNAPATYWLTYGVQPPLPASATAPPGPNAVVAIARYQLTVDDGIPVVSIATLCERPEPDCASFDAFVEKGLPFAKPR